MKDFSKYSGLLKMCGYCSHIKKQEDTYVCQNTKEKVCPTKDAHDCNEFDGENVILPSNENVLSNIVFE